MDDDGGAGVDYTTIQAAVDAAGAGDTIEVQSGVYVENVGVNKTLTLVGEGADVVTVTAASAYGHIFEVTADYVNIRGFTVTGATHYRSGIYLSDADYCDISDNNASNGCSILPGCGIFLDDSSNNTISNNTCSNNMYIGIYLSYSSNTMLAGNTANSNDDGIYLSHSSNNTLAGNMMFGNTYNFGVYSCSYSYSLSNYIQNIDTSNMVDGKPIYYWVDQHDKQIPSDAGFVGVVNCTNITVKGLTLTKNHHGVLFAHTSDSMIENINTSNNGDGIYLSHSSNNILAGNTANSNAFDGIDLHDSSNNTLQSNTMSENRYNFGVDGYGLSDYIQNIDTSNTVDGKPIYYWVDQHDKQIPSDAGFVGVVNCTNITVRGLTLTKNRHGVLFSHTSDSRIKNINTSNNLYGIYMRFSSNNTLAGNTANLNAYGIYLHGSSNNTLANNIANSNRIGIYMYFSSNNTLAGNTANLNDYSIYLHGSSNNTLANNIANSNGAYGYGIYLYRSSNNTLTDNTANSNAFDGIGIHDSSNNTLSDNTASGNHRYGIYIRSSSNNTIHHNNLIENWYNAYDNHINQWDSGSEGNYYSDYTGTDNNTDGIGDDPHPIPGGSNMDYYPLMQPWSPPPKGDLNGDRQITPVDAAIALQIAASGEHNPAADVSGDDRVTSLDALMILQAAAGSIEIG